MRPIVNLGFLANPLRELLAFVYVILAPLWIRKHPRTLFPTRSGVLLLRDASHLFDDPLGLLIELASYRFEPPYPWTHAEVLLEAHKLRVERGDYNIAEVHLADAIERLVERSRGSLSDDRSPKDPYRKT